MTRDEFLEYIKENYRCDGNLDFELIEAEHSDVDGDFIYENKLYVIGKYNYALALKDKSGNDATLRFSIYGTALKQNITPNDYELSNYDNFDYIIK